MHFLVSPALPGENYLVSFDGKLEARSAAWFLGGLLAIAAIWRLFLGWGSGFSVGGWDALSFHFPYIQKLVAAKGNFASLVYDPSWMGGVRLHGTYGTPPIQALLAFLLRDPLQVLNGYYLFQQAVLGWAATRSLKLLRPRTPVLLEVATFLLAAFSPLIAWRIQSGQLNPSFLLLPVSHLVWISIEKGKPLFVDFLLCLFALVNGIAYVGYQYDFYALLFGAPIALALLSNESLLSKRALLGLALVWVSALVMGAAHWLEPLLFFASGEASRQFGQHLHSEHSLQFRDILSSILWGMPGSTEDLHERNYPLGPILLLLTLLWNSHRRTVSVFFACLSLAFLYGVWEFPIPILDTFRNPARALIFPILLLPLLSGLALQKKNLSFLAIVLALGSLWAFHHRVQPVRPEIPASNISSPLTRQVVQPRNEIFSSNTQVVAGIPGVDGYWMPLARYVNFLSSLGQELPATAMNFEHNPSQLGFALVAKRYNVTQASVGPEVQKRFATNGEAWFGDQPGEPLKVEILSPTFSARITFPKTTKPRFLVVSTTYSPVLVARVSSVEMPTLPIFDVLEGIAVPPGESEVILSAESISSSLVWASYLLGLVLALVVFNALRYGARL